MPGEAADQVFPVGSYDIGEIEFDALVDSCFWGTDFLVEVSTAAALGPERRQQLDVSLEAFGISQQLAPHAEELKLEPLAEPPWGSEELGEAPEGPRIPKYPPDAEDA